MTEPALTDRTQSPVRIGVIGLGAISPIYLKNLATWPGAEVVACADALPERAEARAREFGVPRVLGVDDLLNAENVDLVLNLTVPAVHAEIAERALRAGKHVYNEKPLGTELAPARALLDLARERGLLIGCAPDTFLGAGLQTCRDVLDAGELGVPVAASAQMLGSGPESWHPDPHFFFQPGAGPLFDIGPYYLTALVNLLGPVRRASGLARASFPERTVGSGPKAGQTIPVNTPTHVAGVLEFVSGALATLVTSFDVPRHDRSDIQLYGTQAQLDVPDPNTFGGPVRLRGKEGAWQDVPLRRPHARNSRGLGLADLARAVREGGQPRASGELAYHVLESMHALLEAAREGRAVEVHSRPERPEPLPAGTFEEVKQEVKG